MIVGLGVRLVDVPRFEAALVRRGERLRARLFTAGEQAYAARKLRGAESLAVRFAAKLAAGEALGLCPAPWRDVEVVRAPREAPSLRFRGAAAARARALGVTDVALTLTHDADLCVGQVVLEAR